MLTFPGTVPPPGRPQHRTAPILEALHARPGEWARIGPLADGSAWSLQKRLRKACSQVDVEIRYVPETALWARVRPAPAVDTFGLFEEIAAALEAGDSLPYEVPA